MWSEKNSEADGRFVACAIFGGLGNQLFQWAAGFALARLRRCPLYVDTHEGTDCFGREFLLGRLGVYCELLGEERRKSLLGQSAGFLTLGFFDRLLRDHVLGRRIREKHPSDALKKILRARLPVYLSGHFQSEKFFLGQGEEIRSHLRRVTGLDGEYAARSIDAIAVHIRRGDYKLAGVASVLGLCGPGYYAKAVELLREKFGSVPVQVFTDEPQDLETPEFAPLRRQGAQVVSGTDPVEDFRRLCRYRFLVISNSTFSWWAARLSQAEAVVRPRPWFLDPQREKYFDCPEAWISLERAK